MIMAKIFFFVATALSLLATTPTQAQKVLTDKNKIAVSGYDVVSYFAGKPAKGKAEFTASHKGAMYQFLNAENRDKFKQSPSKYTPQYGGWCAYGWAQGYPAKIDPLAWRIVEDKLYLNYDASVQKDWEKKQTEYIKKADENFAKAQSVKK
jgi:YHS domain-containing protein